MFFLSGAYKNAGNIFENIFPDIVKNISDGVEKAISLHEEGINLAIEGVQKNLDILLDFTEEVNKNIDLLRFKNELLFLYHEIEGNDYKEKMTTIKDSLINMRNELKKGIESINCKELVLLGKKIIGIAFYKEGERTTGIENIQKKLKEPFSEKLDYNFQEGSDINGTLKKIKTEVIIFLNTFISRNNIEEEHISKIPNLGFLLLLLGLTLKNYREEKSGQKKVQKMLEELNNEIEDLKTKIQVKSLIFQSEEIIRETELGF